MSFRAVWHNLKASCEPKLSKLSSLQMRYCYSLAVRSACQPNLILNHYQLITGVLQPNSSCAGFCLWVPEMICAF